MGKLFKTVQYTAMFLFMGAGLLLVLCSLPATGWKALSVQTGSMEPHIPTGSLVLVHRTAPTQLNQGDVITYKSQHLKGQTITHRIIERKGLANGPKQFIVKGDANESADAPVGENQVVGRVVGSVPILGRGLNVIRTPWGLAVMVYLPLLLISISEIRLLIRRLTEIEVQKERLQARRQRSPLLGPSHGFGGLAAVSALAMAALITLPTFATPALSAKAALTGNSIAGAVNNPPPPANPNEKRVLLTRVDFPDTPTSKHHHQHIDPVTVAIYNPGRWQKVDMEGWTLESKSGVLYTFVKAREFCRNKGNYINLALDRAVALNTIGDHLVLKNAAGQEIDALSWGTDTSYLNPALQGVEPGTHLKRKNPRTDTNTAQDWRLRW